MKIKYLTRRGRIEFKRDKAFPALLQFQYVQFIRARGEIMLKNAGKVDRLSWANCIRMSDEEFCDYYKVPLQTLVALQKELSPTSELDLPKKHLFKKLRRNYSINAGVGN